MDKDELNNLTEPEAWGSDRTGRGMTLYTALITRALTSPLNASRHDGQINTFIRVLCFEIDPPLYNGSAYGLLRGSAVWSGLWKRVTGIVTRYAQDIPPDDETFGAYPAWRWAADAMAELARDWPEIRTRLIAEVNNETGRPGR